MDPATFYALFTLADGSQRLMHLRQPFPSVEDCERFVDDKRRRHSMTGMTRYVCLPHGKALPTWVSDRQKPKERLIHGVPLNSEYMPRSARW